jgi:hypothetical protein
VVAGFVASPVSAAVATRAPMSQISKTYAEVGRAPKLPTAARVLGAAPTKTSVSGAVALAPRDPAALQRAALAVSNPRSKAYHHYIAKGAFAASYGPSAATINAVKATLTAAHLKVTSVSSNGLMVHFSGTVGSAETAFRTKIANVRMASGRTGTQTTTPVSFPASLARQVVSVVGLDTLGAPHATVERPKHPAAVKAQAHPFARPAHSASACSAATDTANEFGGLTQDEILHSYGADALYTAGDFGAGQTVAIYELEPFDLSDVTAFDTCFFGASAAATMTSHVSVKTVDGGPGTGSGSGESILDIEDVSAVAPGANIEVYEAPISNSGALDEFDQIVNDDSASVVSSSWGECELDAESTQPGYVNVENEMFEQAALQGQSILSASGDSGSDDCAEEAATTIAPNLSVDDPGSQPFVVSVGGTTITDATEPPTQQVWNDGNIGGGGGGGVSSIWGAPSWQQALLDTASAASAVTNSGLTPCQESPSNGALCREVPDVSAQADEYTGGITFYQGAFGGWDTIGGTSSSAPLWAGMLADVNSTAGCISNGPVGFVSPSLYALASIPADYAASFSDLTTGDGNNDVYNISNGQNYKTRPGFDMASGLGTPILAGPNGQAGLASYLCTLAAPPARPVISSLSQPTVPTTPSGTLTITGTGFTGATAVSIGTFAVPSGDWTVTSPTSIDITPIPTGTQALTGSAGPQDGSGRALVSVTGSAGTTSAPGPSSELLYVDEVSAETVPSVSGITAYGGPQAGGNTVAVFGSGFISPAVTGVTVGNVAATNVTVLNANELTMTIPAYVFDTTSCFGADDQTNDVCQAQVVVSNSNGPSATMPIKLPYTGAQFEGTTGGAQVPACVTGGTCEVVPSDTEYDYLPTPTITSVTTTSAGDPTTWASEQGTTIATIDGSGFDSLGFLWTIDGNPALNANLDFSTISVSPTELQVVINPHAPTANQDTVKLTVQTLAGKSASWPLSYAGIPKVSLVSPQYGPDLGGTTMTVTGTGFEGVNAADGGQIAYGYFPFDAATSQLTGYTATSPTSITATTPENNPGEYFVQVCTVTFCSQPTTLRSFDNSIFDFYQRGAPVVTSVSKTSGPASGGTAVKITGQNLSDAVSVTFGKAVAEAASAPAILTNGSSTEIDAIVPPGKAGSTVNIRVATIESIATGSPASAPNSGARFTYKTSVASPPQDVTVTKHTTTLVVHWKAPASSGGHPVLRYRVVAFAEPNSDKKGAKTPPDVVVVTKHGSARTGILTGLRGGWFYQVRVRAVTSKGRGLAGQPPQDFFISDPA